MENSRIKLANEISKRCDNKLVNEIMYYIIDCEKKGYRSDIDIMIKAILDHKYIFFHRGIDRAWGCTPLVSAVVIDKKRIHYQNGYGDFSDCLDAWEIISKKYGNGIYVTESNSMYIDF